MSYYSKIETDEQFKARLKEHKEIAKCTRCGNDFLRINMFYGECCMGCASKEAEISMKIYKQSINDNRKG